MPSIKPIKLWGKGGANPPKVMMFLEELGLPYEIDNVAHTDVKKPEYLAVNPNGRTPTIHDPNTDIKVWESGAIVEYLVEQYDPERRLSFPPGSPEYWQAKQYLFFQVSGQGPYYGQASWFLYSHAEKLPSAVTRYVAEMNRVTGVLEKILSEVKIGEGRDGPWLVGGKFSYADLAFCSWQERAGVRFAKEHYNVDEYPLVKGWMERMLARPAVQRALNPKE